MSTTNSYKRCKSFRTTTRLHKACKVNVRVKVPTQGLVPRTLFGLYDYGVGEKKTKKEHPRLSQLWQLPPPATYTKVRNFGNFSRLLEKKRRRRSKIGFYFLTYVWSRRRLSSIKMINGVEEVLIPLFTVFTYEHLF